MEVTDIHLEEVAVFVEDISRYCDMMFHIDI
jgi:hypothetical protein